MRVHSLTDPRLHYLILFLSILSYALASYGFLGNSSGESAFFSDGINRLLTALSYLGLLAFSLLLERKISLPGPEEIFRYLLIAGLISLSLILVPDVYFIANAPPPWEGFFDRVYPFISKIILISFLLSCFLMFRKLILTQHDAYSRRLLSLFTLLLAISALFVLYPLPGSLHYIYYIIAIPPGFYAATKFNWITNLNSSRKWTIILFLVILNWVFSGLGLKFILDSKDLYLGDDFIRQTFPVLLLGFTGTYSLLVMLSLIFNLPISSVIDQRNTEVKSFQEINRSIGSMKSEEEILELLYRICMDNARAETAWLTLESEDSHRTQVFKTDDVSLEAVTLANEELGGQRWQELESKKTSYLYFPDTRQEGTPPGIWQQYGSLLAFSLGEPNQYTAYMVLLKTATGAFDQRAIRLLATFVDQAKLAIENNRLVDEALESARLKNDFEIARKVQSSLLPQNLPQSDVLRMAVKYQPATEVGGDYYDYFELDDQLCIVIGDVSGKGMSAAFNVAELKGIFHSLKDRLLEPADFLNRVNEAVSHCFARNVFLTLMYLSVDSRNKEIVYSRAGHCPLLLYKASEKKVHYMEDKGIGMGILRNQSYKQHLHFQQLSFDTNDIVVLYTDGVIEAMQAGTKEEYGYERLAKIVERYAYFQPVEIINAIMDDINDFVGERDLHDDISLVVLKFN